jgi:predicted flap endonuclease-1-like 5' DNA nuclease
MFSGGVSMSQTQLRSQNWAIADLPGLSATEQQQLQAQGIQTTFHLLNKTRSAAEVQRLATQLQIPTRFVKKWVALADLARIPSVGCQYCGVLIHVGILSVHQLAQMSAPQVQRQILRLQVTLIQTTSQCPTVGQVSVWIIQAKQL